MLEVQQTKELLNFDEMYLSFIDTNNKNVICNIPSLNDTITLTTTDKEQLKYMLSNCVKNLPHRRIVCTYYSHNNNFIIDIHPVTGAA